MAEILSQEEAIFHAALEIDTADQRSAFLDAACGNEAGLRQCVEALLRRCAESEGPLDRPRFRLETTADCEVAPAAEGPGTVIGPYKLLERIGEGGMGLVFMADQLRPVRRRVALKVLKPGMDTRQVVARFEAERQALALMDHPHIAKVFDGGATASGRPYFVMELVRGVPVTEFCDQHRFTTRQRLELFATVCQAVQHAHQKGIIHRDLKPSNVLVTLHDTVAVPKVIDFGIAKATGQQLTERTLFTNFAQMVGTPLYMSPEQAEMNGLDVDTRSDVYALGVLLYELLTGTTPFESETLRKAGLDEMRRMIREEEPPTPSRRLSTLGAQACSTVSERRGVDGRRLGQVLRGELDWIVMKALEKDRNRRYESASAFAADVQRYLSDEAVAACPASAGYRLRKYVRRNRRLLSTTGLIVTILVSTTAVSLWQAVEAHGALRLADKRLENEKEARNYAETQRRRAQRSFERTINLVSEIDMKLHSEAYRQRPPVDESGQPLADYVAQLIEEMVKVNDPNPVVRQESAQALLHLAGMYARRGKKLDSQAASEKAVAILEALTGEFPQETVYWEVLVGAHGTLGEHFHDAGQRLQAVQEFRKARDAFQQVVEINNLDAQVHSQFARFLSCCSCEEVRDPVAALDHARKSVELEPDRPAGWATLGMAEYRAGNWRACIQAIQKVVELSNRRHGTLISYLPAMAHWQLGEREHARRLLRQADAWMRLNRPAEEVRTGIPAEAARLIGS